MRRRSNGDGAFRKRSANSWEGSIRIDDDRYYVYGNTKAETKEKLSILQNDKTMINKINANAVPEDAEKGSYKILYH